MTSNLQDLREPRALPGWIKIIARRLALTMVQSYDRLVPIEGPQWSLSAVRDNNVDAEARVLSDELRTAVRNGLNELSKPHRELLTLLVADPPISYRQISARLGLPMGSIGPMRARALRKLASTTAMRSFVEAYDGAA